MKLTYRDRIILLVALTVLILVGGFFALIKPKINDIKTSKAERTKVNKEWDEKQEIIAKIKPLQNAINDVYDEATDLANDFVAQNDYAYQLDQQFQKYADKCHIQISKMEASDPKTGKLDYYFLTPVDLTTDMFEAADVNGNYSKNNEQIMAESETLSDRNVEEVVVQQYGIEAMGSREEIWKYMKAIADIDSSVIIESVDINDYTFEIPEDKELQWSAEDENGVKHPTNADSPTQGYSKVTFVVNVYSVYNMDKPDVELKK